jgi:uncharacterized membrane protein YeaQ/YmgE (transglycosylase-associated protein family)
MPIIVGFGTGVLAWLLMPRSDAPYGLIVTTILGMIASVATALFGDAAGLYETGNNARIAGSALGAAVVLLIWAVLSRHDSERG